MTAAEAFELLVELVKGQEGFSPRAYPDPGSPLYKAMAARRLIEPYKNGIGEVPADLRHLSGVPWTIGHGETAGVKENDWWTAEYAGLRLRHRLAEFMGGVLARCPVLAKMDPRRLVACTSLAYNIGLGAFGASSVCRYTKRGELEQAAKSFALWNKSQGKVLAGLVRRRALEALIFQLLYPQS